MDTSICIYNERIAAVRGRALASGARIRRFASVPLPEQTVINGVVTDEARFTEAFRQLEGELGGPRITRALIALSTSQIYVRRAVVPNLPKRRLLQWAENAFSDMDSADDELLYDCAVLTRLGRDRGSAALVLAAKKSLIASYDELFSSLDVRIDGIDSTHFALQKLTRLLKGTRERTSIVLAFDGNVLDSTLYGKGLYRFSTRTRLLAERGTAEGAREVERTVSSILQFNVSERGDAVTDVFFTGLLPAEDGLMRSVAAAFPVNAAALCDPEGAVRFPRGSEVKLADYACAVGNLIGRWRA